MSHWFVVAIAPPTIYYLQKTFIVQMRETNDRCCVNGLTVCLPAVLCIDPDELIRLAVTLNAFYDDFETFTVALFSNKIRGKKYFFQHVEIA